MEKVYDHLFKLLLIGDTGVGKTNFFNKFVDGTTNEEYAPSVSF